MEVKKMEKMRVIAGEHKGQIVEVTGIHWFCNTITAILEDGTEYDFAMSELDKIIQSETMKQFLEVIEEVDKLREKERLLKERFEKSTEELSECFHYILQFALRKEKACCLTIYTCPELYAKELSGMGFKVEEMRNCANILCGYTISWE